RYRSRKAGMHPAKKEHQSGQDKNNRGKAHRSPVILHLITSYSLYFTSNIGKVNEKISVSAIVVDFLRKHCFYVLKKPALSAILNRI
ncbi:MAG: hypothetical protein IIV23_04070, partial [Ruminococcus sp.]|nr:hypothetical protein [Ruminococcus sp.]